MVQNDEESPTAPSPAPPPASSDDLAPIVEDVESPDEQQEESPAEKESACKHKMMEQSVIREKDRELDELRCELSSVRDTLREEDAAKEEIVKFAPPLHVQWAVHTSREACKLFVQFARLKRTAWTLGHIAQTTRVRAVTQLSFSGAHIPPSGISCAFCVGNAHTRCSFA